MSILEKAYELGQEIAASKELAEMKNAEIAMMNNEEARNLIKEFNQKQKQYMELQKQGIPLTESQKNDVQDLEKRMLDNPFVYRFFQAQQNFERVLQEINEIISKAIAGEHSSCSDGSCSTCGGCCDH